MIAGGETESVHLVLIAQARIERTAERRAHAGLHRLHGDWAQPRKLPADRAGSRLHLVVADDELDQAQAEGLLRVNGIAREWEPHRLTVSDAPWEWRPATGCMPRSVSWIRGPSSSMSS